MFVCHIMQPTACLHNATYLLWTVQQHATSAVQAAPMAFQLPSGLFHHIVPLLLLGNNCHLRVHINHITLDLFRVHAHPTAFSSGERCASWRPVRLFYTLRVCVKTSEIPRFSIPNSIPQQKTTIATCCL